MGHARRGGHLHLENATIEEVYGAGVFIQNLASTDILNLNITNVHQHADESEYGADAYGAEGLVILQTSTSAYEPISTDAVSVDLLGSNSFIGIGRAGIIADAAHLKLDPMSAMDATDTRDGISIFGQNDALIEFTADFSDGSAPSIGLVESCDIDDSIHLDSDGFDFGAGL